MEMSTGVQGESQPELAIESFKNQSGRRDPQRKKRPDLRERTPGVGRAGIQSGGKMGPFWGSDVTSGASAAARSVFPLGRRSCHRRRAEPELTRVVPFAAGCYAVFRRYPTPLVVRP